MERSQRILEPVGNLGLGRSRTAHGFAALELAVLSTQVEVGSTREPDGDRGGSQVDRERHQVSGRGLVEVRLWFESG